MFWLMNKDSSHKHNTDQFFDELVQTARQGAGKEDVPKSGLKSDEDFADYYDFEESKKRSRSITSILQSYENSYKNKVSFQNRFRKILFWICNLIILVFIITIVFILHYTIKNARCIDISAVATLITALLSLFVSIFKLLNIITKYCFPKNDDEYVIKIVKSIQKDDFERIKEHNKYMEKHNQKFTYQNSKSNKIIKLVPKKKK